MPAADKIPLIDRSLFFGNPDIEGGQLSPDGKFITFLKEFNGIMNVWIKEYDDPFDKAKPITDSQRPLYGYSWTKDSRFILFVKDKDGDENLNIFAVDPFLAVDEEGIPTARNLTSFKEVTAQIYAVSQNDPNLLLIGLNNRDPAWHDLYSLKISSGELEFIYENKDRITGYSFDWDDALRLLYRTDEKGNNTILSWRDGEPPQVIYETPVTEQAYVAGWNEDNSLAWLVSNKGEVDLLTLYSLNPTTGEVEKVEDDPQKKVDFGSLRIDRNTRKIISSSYKDDRTRIYWRDKNWEGHYTFLKEKFPGREISYISSTKDYSKLLISVWGDRFAPDIYLFDTKIRQLIHQYTPRPQLKKIEKWLAPMHSISYSSSDGLMITGYLTIPNEMESRNLPLVVLVHGGPKGPRDHWGYNPLVQFLANRGYAVLQPNFRASGGFGKSFMNAGDLQWGKLMQDDISWGVKHLLNEGVAEPSRVGIMGGSYGGYATLAGLAFTPELYACGVDIVGPSNIFTLLESIPPYWEAGRSFLYGMVGDPNTPEGRERIREASPLFSSDRINKPLLIIQGANDPRVKKAESDQIVIELRDKKKPVTYLLADDEGHGFAKPVNRMAMFAETEKFLSEFLGGRYQKEVPDDIKKRLKELTVDIDRVTYTLKEDALIQEDAEMNVSH